MLIMCCVTLPGTVTLNVSAGSAAINRISMPGDWRLITDNATSGGLPRNGAVSVTMYTAKRAYAGVWHALFVTGGYLPAASYGSTAPVVYCHDNIIVSPQIAIGTPNLPWTCLSSSFRKP